MAACPFPGITMEPFKPVLTPVIVVNSNVTNAELDEGLARAIPLCIVPIWPGEPDASTYKRNALLARSAGAPASVTVTPAFFNEKTATPVGVLPEVGVTRTEPALTSEAVPGVAMLTELRGAIE